MDILKPDKNAETPKGSKALTIGLAVFGVLFLIAILTPFILDVIGNA